MIPKMIAAKVPRIHMFQHDIIDMLVIYIVKNLSNTHIYWYKCMTYTYIFLKELTLIAYLRHCRQ